MSVNEQDGKIEQHNSIHGSGPVYFGNPQGGAKGDTDMYSP